MIFSAAASGGGLVALASPASNTSHGITGHPCAGASGLQGPDDLSPLRTPLSESGFAGGEAMIECLSGKDAGLDAPIYFTYLGLNCQRVGIGPGRGVICGAGSTWWYVRWQRFWGVISRIG